MWKIGKLFMVTVLVFGCAARQTVDERGLGIEQFQKIVHELVEYQRTVVVPHEAAGKRIDTLFEVTIPEREKVWRDRCLREATEVNVRVCVTEKESLIIQHFDATYSKLDHDESSLVVYESWLKQSTEVRKLFEHLLSRSRSEEETQELKTVFRTLATELDSTGTFDHPEWVLADRQAVYARILKKVGEKNRESRLKAVTDKYHQRLDTAFGMYQKK